MSIIIYDSYISSEMARAAEVKYERGRGAARARPANGGYSFFVG